MEESRSFGYLCPHCKKPVLDVTQEDLQSVLDVHLMGSFALTKAVVPGMLERKKGNILFISSMSAAE